MLIQLGFQSSKAYTFLYMLHIDIIHQFFLIYVDDIIITGSHQSEINRVITALASEFPVNDLGDLFYFLGVEALRTKAGLFLTQMKYILELLKRAGLDTAKPCMTHMASSCRISKFDGHDYEDGVRYHCLVGGL